MDQGATLVTVIPRGLSPLNATSLMASVPADQGEEEETAVNAKPTTGETPKCSADLVSVTDLALRPCSVTVAQASVSVSRESLDTNVIVVTEEPRAPCLTACLVESASIIGIQSSAS